MKNIFAVLSLFSILIDLSLSAQAGVGHEISHVSVKHAAEAQSQNLPEEEGETFLVAETEEGEETFEVQVQGNEQGVWVSGIWRSYAP